MSSKRFPPLTEEEFNSIMDFSLNEEEEEYLFNTSDSSSTSSSSSSGSSSTSSSSSSGSSSAHTVESIDSMDEDEDEDEYYSSGQEDEQENATVILDNIPIPVMRNKILEKVECEWMPQKKIKIWCIKNEDIEACVPHIVEEDAIPSFHCFTHFIPASSMAQSPRTFSDILTHNIVGSTAHFSLAFHGAAFSNQENGVSEKPGIGPYDSLFKKETDVCTIGEVLYPKIACFLELVVRECRCHDAMRSTLPLHELFRQKNIAGYRV